jgi:hypothetical protein
VKLLEMPRRKWGNKIKMDLRETDCKDRKCMEMYL